MFSLGIIFSFLFGAALPCTFIIFAYLIDDFGGTAASEDELAKNFALMEKASQQGIDVNTMIAQANGG